MEPSDTIAEKAGRRRRYTVLFEPAEEGGYVVQVPALPGLWTQGETLAEARDMAKDAIVGYVESLLKAGETIPPDAVPAAPVKEVLEVSL